MLVFSVVIEIWKNIVLIWDWSYEMVLVDDGV